MILLKQCKTLNLVSAKNRCKNTKSGKTDKITFNHRQQCRPKTNFLRRNTPFVGTSADTINAVISVARGKYADARWSAVGVVPIAGDFIKGAGKGKKLLDAGQKAAEKAVKHDKEVASVTQSSDQITKTKKPKPIENHHFATNKHSFYTEQFKKITDRYKLDLDGDWNREFLPHQGRHTELYHRAVLEKMQKAAKEFGKDKQKFLELYEKYVKDWVRNNPDKMYKAGWK